MLKRNSKPLCIWFVPVVFIHGVPNKVECEIPMGFLLKHHKLAFFHLKQNSTAEESNRMDIRKVLPPCIYAASLTLKVCSN